MEAAKPPPNVRLEPPSARPDPLVGTVLGGTYELVRVIGTGGVGTVYEARHVRLPKRFAIKVLKPEAAKDQAALGRFRQEAEIASSVGNEHIVDVQDWNVLDDGSPYMVMELLEGEDLAIRLERGGRLPVGQVLNIVEQVCNALDAAHARGIVHRDIKPDNVFMVRSATPGVPERIKLLDFGLSKVRGAVGRRLTGDLSVVGTPWYMSPEQARGAEEVDSRTDLYSLSAMTYLLLCGRLPFEGDNVYGILHRIVNEPPPALRDRAPELPPEVDAVVMRGLSKNREERFATAGAFWVAFHAAIDGKSTVDEPSQPIAIRSETMVFGATPESVARRSDTLMFGGDATALGGKAPSPSPAPIVAPGTPTTPSGALQIRSETRLFGTGEGGALQPGLDVPVPAIPSSAPRAGLAPLPEPSLPASVPAHLSAAVDPTTVEVTAPGAAPVKPSGRTPSGEVRALQLPEQDAVALAGLGRTNSLDDMAAAGFSESQQRQRGMAVVAATAVGGLLLVFGVGRLIRSSPTTPEVAPVAAAASTGSATNPVVAAGSSSGGAAVAVAVPVATGSGGGVEPRVEPAIKPVAGSSGGAVPAPTPSGSSGGGVKPVVVAKADPTPEPKPVAHVVPKVKLVLSGMIPGAVATVGGVPVEGNHLEAERDGKRRIEIALTAPNKKATRFVWVPTKDTNVTIDFGPDLVVPKPAEPKAVAKANPPVAPVVAPVKPVVAPVAPTKAPESKKPNPKPTKKPGIDESDL